MISFALIFLLLQHSFDTPKDLGVDSDRRQKLSRAVCLVGNSAELDTSEFVLVDVENQSLLLCHVDSVSREYRISTSRSGASTWSALGSERTPLGLFVIHDMLGDSQPKDMAYRERLPIGQMGKTDNSKGDLVLARIFVLEGCDQGMNKGYSAYGTNVDAVQRRIYIHGTNDEKSLGRPASHGCIRMSPDDAIDLFGRVKVGTYVTIL